MKCPYCGSTCADDAQFCPSCKQPLAPVAPRPEAEPVREAPAPWWRRAGFVIFGIACLAALLVGIYKLVVWVDNYQLNRLYTRGEYAPSLSLVDLDDMRQGHAIVFYGHDGDQIFLPEMGRSLTISGGVARMVVPDADWFSQNVTGIDHADITLTPMLVAETGRKTKLPAFNFQIEVPESPLAITSPARNNINVITSVYPLVLNVVPGSTVFVNSEDVTASVDRSGLLSTHVSVKPIGDNVITIIVRTPQHRECRRDLVIHREHYDINLELDTSVGSTSSARTIAITGTAEPGAMIAVDTDYIEESLSVDMTTGRFSFIAKLATYGDNTIRFHATKDGRQDARLSFTVRYKPTLADYSAKAWRMDYKQLSQLFEQWRNRVFQCKGELVDITTGENGETYWIMDVSEVNDNPKLLVLENQSNVKNVTPGRRYIAYAHVDGQQMYNAAYYPKLICLYIDLDA